jgi:hypothetical protein
VISIRNPHPANPEKSAAPSTATSPSAPAADDPMKQGAHTYLGHKIGRANRLMSKLGRLEKIRAEVWLSVFPRDSAILAAKRVKIARHTAKR